MQISKEWKDKQTGANTRSMEVARKMKGAGIFSDEIICELCAITPELLADLRPLDWGKVYTYQTEIEGV